MIKSDHGQEFEVKIDYVIIFYNVITFDTLVIKCDHVIKSDHGNRTWSRYQMWSRYAWGLVFDSTCAILFFLSHTDTVNRQLLSMQPSKRWVALLATVASELKQEVHWWRRVFLFKVRVIQYDVLQICSGSSNLSKVEELNLRLILKSNF